MYERATGCPFRNSCTIRTTEKETFDLVLNDKVLCCNYHSPYLTFNYRSLEWKCVLNNISFCNDYHNNNWQLSSNPHLVHFYSETNKVNLSVGDNPRIRHMNLYARYLNFETKERNIINSPSWCLFAIEVPLQLRYLVDYTMLRCGSGGVIFLGGEYIVPQRLKMILSYEDAVVINYSDGLFSNKILWHGELSKDGNNMSWTAIRLGVKLIRPMCFKLKNNLYILDSWHGLGEEFDTNSCCKYNLRERQFYRNVFGLPFIYFPGAFNEPQIVTDANETFAIIVVRVACQSNVREDPYGIKPASIKERVWIFTEDEGFRALSDLETTSTYSTSQNNGNLVRIQ